MSGEFYCFTFCLRGPDSLASKWISEKRNTKGGLKENGANIYAISDYIHKVFCFEKLYGTEHTSNVLFNQIIKLNNFDKDHIVLFEDIILIPFTFSMRSYESGSFKEFSNDFEQEPIYEDKPASKSKLGDLLSATEIKEMLINIYHINYDLRSDDNIKDKKYDEIIKGEYLNFKDKAKLDLFVPYIFEIPTQKVVKSSEEAPVEVLMEETTVQPEVINTAVAGKVDGQKKYGTVSEDLIELLKRIETPKPDQDGKIGLHLPGDGTVTYGYGEVIKGETEITDELKTKYPQMTEEEATQRLKEDVLPDYETYVSNKLYNRDMSATQQEFDAYVLDEYNTNSGPLMSKIKNSTDKSNSAVTKIFKGHKITYPGLTKRREAEAKVYTEGDYSEDFSW